MVRGQRTARARTHAQRTTASRHAAGPPTWWSQPLRRSRIPGRIETSWVLPGPSSRRPEAHGWMDVYGGVRRGGEVCEVEKWGRGAWSRRGAIPLRCAAAPGDGPRVGQVQRDASCGGDRRRAREEMLTWRRASLLSRLLVARGRWGRWRGVLCPLCGGRSGRRRPAIRPARSARVEPTQQLRPPMLAPAAAGRCGGFSSLREMGGLLGSWLSSSGWKLSRDGSVCC